MKYVMSMLLVLIYVKVTYSYHVLRLQNLTIEYKDICILVDVHKSEKWFFLCVFKKHFFW